MTLTISVALCTHNGAEFIAEQLASVLAQTRLPDEVIISDDASDDSTVALATGLLNASAIKWRLIQNESPLGVTRNFEQAIRACTGSLVSLCDQDDLWHPERLEFIAQKFEESAQSLLLHSDARLIDDRGAVLAASLLESLEVTDSERREILGGDALSALLRRNLVTGATVVFRRELFASAQPFPTAWVHDEWLAMVAALTGGVRLVERPLIDYRQHAGNEIGATRPTLRVKVERVLTPRVERNEQLLARAKALLEYVESASPHLPDSVVDAVRQKMRHETVRNGLSRRRILRTVPILKEAVSGRYARFGRGFWDAVRDQLQPA